MVLGAPLLGPSQHFPPWLGCSRFRFLEENLLAASLDWKFPKAKLGALATGEGGECHILSQVSTRAVTLGQGLDRQTLWWDLGSSQLWPSLVSPVAGAFDLDI